MKKINYQVDNNGYAMTKCNFVSGWYVGTYICIACKYCKGCNRDERTVTCNSYKDTGN